MNISCARSLAVVILASFTLAGCFDESLDTGPVQTVDWYKEHDNERQTLLEKCSNNPGELKNDPNCTNAL